MSSQTLLYLVTGVAVLGLLVYRQLVTPARRTLAATIRTDNQTNSGGNGVVPDSRILAGHG